MVEGLNHAVTFQQAYKECETSGSILPSGVAENELIAMVTKMKERRLDTVWLSLRLEKRFWHWINKTKGDYTNHTYHINSPEAIVHDM